MAKRRRGARSARPRHPQHVRFDELVGRALAGIPMPFAAALEEVAIVIEDEPTEDQLGSGDADPGEGLYGYYEGVPRTVWGSDWGALPNKITLFRLPLEADFADPDELADEV